MRDFVAVPTARAAERGGQATPTCACGTPYGYTVARGGVTVERCPTCRTGVALRGRTLAAIAAEDDAHAARARAWFASQRSPADQLQRATAQARAATRRSIGGRRLTPADDADYFERWADGEMLTAASHRTGVGDSTIHDAVRREATRRGFDPAWPLARIRLVVRDDRRGRGGVA